MFAIFVDEVSGAENDGLKAVMHGHYPITLSSAINTRGIPLSESPLQAISPPPPLVAFVA